MNWTVGRKIAGGYVVLLILLLIVAGAGIWSIHDADRVLGATIDEQAERNGKILNLRGRFTVANLDLLQFLLTGEEAFLAAWKEGLSQARRALDDLQRTAPTAGIQASWMEVARLADAREEQSRRVIALKRAGKLDQAVQLVKDELDRQGDAQRDLITRTIEAERRHLAGTVAAANAAARAAMWTMIVVAAIAAVVAIAIAVGLGRSITRVLRASLSTLAVTSTEIVSATTEQAAGAAEEATAVQETSTSVEEVKQTAQMSAQKARVVADTSQRTAQIATEGRQAVDDSVRSMQETRARMEAIAERVLALSEQAQAIAEIIATVNDLAEQSNLLSVNAAIEAAKAGDAGRGFAVVATEVKALAERSKQATAQVRTILGDIQRATQTAVMAAEQGVKTSDAGEAVVRKAGESIRVLTDSVTESAQVAQQILAAAQQQSAGMDQIGLAMQNIQQAATQNVAATRQVERAARNLQELAARLALLVEVRSNGHPGVPAAH